MFERFTERARQVVLLAQDEARKTRSETIESEHLLIGLLAEEEGLASRVLEDLGITIDLVRTATRTRLGEGRGVGDTEERIPFTAETKKMLELALREALSLGHNYIGTEHILLGVIRIPESAAVVLLARKFGATASDASMRVHNAVLRALTGPDPEVAGQKRPRDQRSGRIPEVAVLHQWRTLITRVHEAMTDQRPSHRKMRYARVFDQLEEAAGATARWLRTEKHPES